MVHESVLDVIDDDYGDDSDFEHGYEEEEEDEEAGKLQSGFQAMDITRRTGQVEESFDEDGEIRDGRVDPDGGRAEGRNDKDGVKKRRKKKKRGGQRRKEGSRSRQTMSIEGFVVQTCRRLEETKYPLFREAVDRIGIDGMKALLNQVDVIEKCGGQMTADGARRRSAGGVLWKLLRDHVGPGMYREIMKEGNRKYLERQKERQKEKERGSGKRQHAEVDTEGDEGQSVKRRRTEMDIDGSAAPVGKRGSSIERQPGASLRGEADNLRASVALQNAWVQGLKKLPERETPSNENTLNPKPLEANGVAGSTATDIKRPVSERIRMTVSYGDLVEEGEIASDSPIRGLTQVHDPGSEDQEARAQPYEDVEDMREEGEIDD